MDYNEHYVKLSGKFGPIPQGLIAEDDNAEFRVNIEGISFVASWVKSELMNNNDGTVDKVYTLKYHHSVESDYEPAEFQIMNGHLEQIARSEPEPSQTVEQPVNISPSLYFSNVLKSAEDNQGSHPALDNDRRSNVGESATP